MSQKEHKETDIVLHILEIISSVGADCDDLFTRGLNRTLKRKQKLQV